MGTSCEAKQESTLESEPAAHGAIPFRQLCREIDVAQEVLPGSAMVIHRDVNRVVRVHNIADTVSKRFKRVGRMAI